MHAHENINRQQHVHVHPTACERASSWLRTPVSGTAAWLMNVRQREIQL
jgi:hypothetical protein